MTNEEILKKTLNEIIVNHKFANSEYKIEPISSGGANYTSELYNVTLKEGTCRLNPNTHHLFVKVATMPEMVRNLSPRFYYTENFVYSKLLNIYEGIEERNQVPREHRLALSRFYGCSSVLYEETLVLENLVKNGYEAYDRFKSVDWNYSKAAVKELVKLHALSFAFSEYNLNDFIKVIDDFKFEYYMKSGPILDYFIITRDRAFNSVQEKDKDKLVRFYEVFDGEAYATIFRPIRRPVLIHGDFRPSNLMHKMRKDDTVDIKVLDLQTMQGGSPIVDLLYFIFTGSDEQFRNQYYDKLIDFYYTELAAAMKRFHLDPEKVYSRADFDYELKQKLPFGLSIAVFTLPIVTVAEEDAPKVDELMDMSSFATGSSSDLYVTRLNGIINDYVKWGILK